MLQVPARSHLNALHRLLLVLLIGAFTCCCQRKSAVDEKTAALDQKLSLQLGALQDLDLGNTEAARRKLANDCLQIVASIVEDIGSLDREDLYKQESLREAAKYWKGKPFPANLPLFNRSGVAVSNRVFEALGIVGAQLDMNVPTRPLRAWERHFPRIDVDSDKLKLDLALIPALDAGKIDFARAKLAQSCLGAVYWVAQGAGASTDLLCAQAGLRAAAAYWATNPLPSDTEILKYKPFSNSVYQALQAVQAQSGRKAAGP